MNEKKEITREDVSSFLDKLGLPDFPEEWKAKAAEVSEENLQALTVEVCMQQLFTSITLCDRVQSRCSLCAIAQTQCPMCTEDAKELREILIRIAALTRMTVHATAPGSRIAAQREAQREREAAEKKPETPETPTS